jgi:RNA polymerase primary sigma factor
MDTIPLEYSYALSDAGKSPEEEAFLSELKRSVTYVLSYLTAREERVIRKRFGIGLNKDETLEEIGQEFCVTRERIRGIEAKALRKLKYPTLARKLRPFLPDVIDAIYDPIL